MKHDGTTVSEVSEPEWLPKLPRLRIPTKQQGRATIGLRRVTYNQLVHIEQTAILVDDYDSAIRFYVQVLGFELVEDSPSLTNDGRAKRWVIVRPPGAATGLLLAQADGDHQRAVVGAQFAGRVGLFLRVDDFDDTYRRILDLGVEFLTEPRDEAYGRFAVFVDIAGNKWDLLGPRHQ